MSQQALFDTAVALLSTLPIYEAGRVLQHDQSILYPDLALTGQTTLVAPAAVVRKGKGAPNSTSGSSFPRRITQVVDVDDYFPQDQDTLTWATRYNDHTAALEAALVPSALVSSDGPIVTVDVSAPSVVNLTTNVTSFVRRTYTISRRER